MLFDQLPLPLDPPPASPVRIPSFAEARALIRTWTDLSETQRAPRITALRDAAEGR